MPVVEDDRYIAGLVEMELEHRGFEVRCAYDGPSALEAARKFDPAVIVLDIMLPGLDGVGVLKRLRSGGSRAPVVMLTARDAPMDKVHSLERGADDWKNATNRPSRPAYVPLCVPHSGSVGILVKVVSGEPESLDPPPLDTT